MGSGTLSCDHGQLARSCLLCEMRDENERLKREGLDALQEWAETESRFEAEAKALRAQVATYEYAMEACRVTIVELQSRLADCQSVIRDRGHDWHCPAVLCEKCGFHQNSSWHKESNDPNDWCIFEPKDACSDACGHDRCAGDKT